MKFYSSKWVGILGLLGVVGFLPGIAAAQTDVQITKGASPSPVVPGGTLTYTLTVENVGLDPAAVIVVKDPLPAGTVFVSCTPSQGTCVQSGGTVTASPGVLATTGATATATIVVKAPTVASGGCATPLTNIATVTAAGDANAANNTATTETTCAVTPSKVNGVADNIDPPPGESSPLTVTMKAADPGLGDLRNLTSMTLVDVLVEAGPNELAPSAAGLVLAPRSGGKANSMIFLSDQNSRPSARVKIDRKSNGSLEIQIKVSGAVVDSPTTTPTALRTTLQVAGSNGKSVQFSAAPSWGDDLVVADRIKTPVPTP
ncbi:MAG: DUF11 domain-containing protein [Deltaproteobacteria bacterium]|nr:DUF11 domain-containing protein [Deltaproteobacteria bacterium]